MSDEETSEVQETEPAGTSTDTAQADDPRVTKANQEAAKYRRELRAREAELERLHAAAQEAEDAKLSDLEKANKAATDAAARADQLAAQVARYKVIAKTQLPEELHEFLPEGIADEEALLARAEKLRSALGKPPAGPRPDPGQGPRPPSPQSEDDALYESIYGPAAQK
ncbi:hypothetical protein ACIBEF_00545 [Micromonospora sp. NPDC050795]|uniref:hypothetical protein n=1 Tax=Micromonospora sp. NPDC050795 TaxID=3364282 RepID=UPI003794E897